MTQRDAKESRSRSPPVQRSKAPGTLWAAGLSPRRPRSLRLVLRVWEDPTPETGRYATSRGTRCPQAPVNGADATCGGRPAGGGPGPPTTHAPATCASSSTADQSADPAGMVLDAFLRLDLATAQELGVALLAAAERHGDEVILVEAKYAMGVTSFWAGRFREARDHLQQAIDRYAPERHETHVTLYSQDPKVVCLSRLAWTLWFLGRRDEAADARDTAVSLGDTLGHPLSRCYAYFYGAIVSQELGDEASRARLVAAAETIATDARVDVLRGWSVLLAHAASALRGDRVALAAMVRAISGFEERGQTLLMAYFRSLLGRAYLVAGDPERGLEAVAGALVDPDRTGFRYLKSELHGLRGELLAASGADAARIDGAFDLARDIACRQEAEPLE